MKKKMFKTFYFHILACNKKENTRTQWVMTERGYKLIVEGGDGTTRQGYCVLDSL